MKRLIRVSLICFSLLILLCATATFIGHTEPETTFIPELTSCGISLCYLGIVPGKTLLDKGMAIIQNYRQLLPAGADYRYLKANYTIQFNTVEVDHTAQTPVIGEIDIQPDHSLLPIGALINTLGIPCYVDSYYGGTDLVYGNARIVVPITTNRLTPMTPVGTIVIAVIPESNNEPCSNFLVGGAEVVSWQGFKEYR